MKIGIITIHKSPNYGACLQSYALWKYIEQQGCECEIIDLCRPYQKEYVPSKKFHLMRQHNTFIDKCKYLVKKILHTKEKEKYLYFSAPAKRKFDDFNSLMNYSKKYLGIDSLYANPPLYDLYISGSDQLWNPTQPYCLEPYFLTFVPNNLKKISYATSIGITTLTKKEKQKFKKWLSSYDVISVREQQGKLLLESFLDNKDIQQVPDPTFLLDVEDWKKLAINPHEHRKYILLFTLQWAPLLVEYCKKLRDESNLELIVLTQIQPKDVSGEYIPITDAGPKEFIGYIANAELVITDSFHCTVFSIITGVKNFYSYISPLNNRGSRITDLLDVFALNDHLLPTDLSIDYDELCGRIINHEQIQMKMELVQQQGRKFIDKFIK